HGATHSGFSQVILLPNNPNVLMTAQQARALARVDLKVVPTRTICEGIAAMVAFNPTLDLEANMAAMTEAASLVQTIELTRAVRSTRINGLQVEEGQVIGLLNGKLVDAGEELDEVALDLIEQVNPAEREVVTVYCGDEVSIREGELLAESIRARWPHIEVQVVDGGQPHYPYILSVE
ncbi:MAG: DAK2 domain-containing protein, partial [Chloroflexota bacterium]